MSYRDPYSYIDWRLRVHALEREKEALLDRIPAWRDSGVKEMERKLLIAYLQAVGFRDEEIAEMNDSREMALHYEAMLRRFRRILTREDARK